MIKSTKLTSALKPTLSLALLLTKASNFLFISIAVFSLNKVLDFSLIFLQAAAVSGIILIFAGPITHRLSIKNFYKIPIILSLFSFLIGIFAIFSLDYNLAIFITLLCNLYGKTILDTIFVTEGLVFQRSFLNISLDLIRIILFLIGFINPILFILPLFLELAFLFLTIETYKIKQLSNEKFTHIFFLFQSFWWILSQRVSSLIFIFHLEKLSDPYIYSYCVLLASQLSGLFETAATVYWIDALAKLKQNMTHFASEIIKILKLSYILTIIMIVFILIYGDFIIELRGVKVDVTAVILLTLSLFTARFATLNINHIALYSSRKSIFNFIFIINMFIFIFMFYFNTLHWSTFLLSYIVTATCFLIFSKQIYSFSIKRGDR